MNMKPEMHNEIDHAITTVEQLGRCDFVKESVRYTHPPAVTSKTIYHFTRFGIFGVQREFALDRKQLLTLADALLLQAHNHARNPRLQDLLDTTILDAECLSDKESNYALEA